MLIPKELLCKYPLYQFGLGLTNSILGVNDGSHSVNVGWYDVSGMIPFVDQGKTEAPGARRGWVWTI